MLATRKHTLQNVWSVCYLTIRKGNEVTVLGGVEHQTCLRCPNVVDGWAQSSFGRLRFFFVDETVAWEMVHVNKVMAHPSPWITCGFSFLFYCIFPKTSSGKSPNHLCTAGAFHVRQREIWNFYWKKEKVKPNGKHILNCEEELSSDRK